MPSLTLSRRIFFYRVFHEPNDGIRRDTVDVRSLLARISELRFEDGQGYFELSDGRSMCAWIGSGGAGRLILGVKRHYGLPQVEDVGRRLPLPLRDHQDLVECTHLVFFPTGILGAEFNFYGPRAHKLGDFVANKFSDLPLLHFHALTDRRVAEKLANLEDVRQVSLRLHKDYFYLLDQAQGSMAAGFNALEEISDAPVIEVVFRQEPRLRAPLSQRIMSVVNSVAGEPMIREAAEKFQVRGKDRRTGRTETFDFLKDNFVSVKEVVRQDHRSRAVDADDMFRAIEQAYNEREVELLAADGVSDGV